MCGSNGGAGVPVENSNVLKVHQSVRNTTENRPGYPPPTYRYPSNHLEKVSGSVHVAVYCLLSNRKEEVFLISQIDHLYI